MSPSISEREEYLTIIAPTAIEVMAQFKARGLDRQGFAIAGKIGRHQVSILQGSSYADLLDDPNMVAATFSRRVNS